MHTLNRIKRAVRFASGAFSTCIVSPPDSRLVRHPLNDYPTGVKTRVNAGNAPSRARWSHDESTNADIEQNAGGAPLIRGVDLRSGAHAGYAPDKRVG